MARAWPAQGLSLGQRAIIIGKDFTLWVVEEAWDAAALDKVGKDICQEAIENVAKWVAYGEPAGRNFSNDCSFCRDLRPGDEEIAARCKQVLQEGGAMILAVYPAKEQCGQRIVGHRVVKVLCSMYKEKGIRGSEDRPMSESPDISRGAMTRCKIGAASNSEWIAVASTVTHRYPEDEYAVQVPLNTARPGAVVETNKGTGATVKEREGIDQYVYKKGETSENEVTIWQQEAYDKHLIRGARHQL